MLDLSNPFPGLRCFLSEEDYLFFGRHGQIDDLLRRLRTNRLVAVVGTSGSGKSSLVRAGLLPAVLGGGMAHAGSAWEIAVLRPGGSPMAHLARALCTAGLYDADAEDALFHLQATLSRSRNGLIEAVRQSRAADARLLLVVDQFEELFRFHRASATSQEEAIGFVNLLLHATQQADRHVYVVLTMRSDFLGECSQFLGLAEAVNDGEFLIPRMTRDQIQEAIEGPIRVRGAAIAPRLLFRLLNDVEDSQDQLPVLQHALMRTWELWQRSEPGGGAVLDLEHYEATGGMHAALSRHADEIFAALPSEAHRAAAARLFKALTERGPDGRGIRRPTRLGALVAIAAVDGPVVQQVIEAYRAPGVTFLMPPVSAALDGGTVIDISHESLMRVWRRLRSWVEEEAQSARIYRRLHETAELHAEQRAGLYHDPDLQIARSWREVSGPNAAWAEQYGGGFAEAMAFLDTSRVAAERAATEREASRQRELERARQLAESQARVARLFKGFAGGLALGLCLAMALTIWAFVLWQEADVQTQEAKRQEADANEQRLVAEEEEAKALELVELVLNVDTPKVPAHIAMLTGQRHLSDAMLREFYDEAPAKSARKLHASLALLPVDAGQVDYLRARLLETDARELPVIRDALAPHKDGLLDGLWAAAETPEKGTEAQRLRAAAALAQYDPDSARWGSGLQAETVVFLASLQEKNVRVLGTYFRKDGFVNCAGLFPVVVDGARCSNALFTHPAATSFASVTYDLDRPYTRFLARVGIPVVTAQQKDPTAPLTFEIIADGKSIWKSTPMAKRGDIQDCALGMRGVKQLELRVHNAGSSSWAHPVWLEPRLTADPEAEVGVAVAVVNELVAMPGADSSAWKDALRPVRGKLLAPLLAVYRSSNRSAEDRALARDILADYAADQPQVLTELLMDGDDKQFAVVFPKLNEHRDRAVNALLAEFDRRAVVSRQADLSDRIILQSKGMIAGDDARVMTRFGLLGAKRFEVLLQAGKQYRLSMDSTDVDSFLVLQDKARKELAFDDDTGGNLNALLVYTPDRTDTYAVFAAALPLGNPKSTVKSTGAFVLKIVETVQGGDGNEKLPKQLANGVLALLQMKQPGKVWPLLQHGRDPRVQGYLIERIGLQAFGAYAADQPSILGDLLMDADDKQFAILLPSIKALGKKGLPMLTGEIDKALPPDAPENAREKLAKRQANAAVALLRLGQPEWVWPLLKQRPDPTARSYLIHRLGLFGADARVIVKQLEQESDPATRRALVLSLGEFNEKDLPPDQRKALVPMLQEMYRTARDPGLHAASAWLLRQWNQEVWLKDTNQAWAGDKQQQVKRLEQAMLELSQEPSPLTAHHSPRWYINGQGQTFVVVPGPATFWMGSPPTEAGRDGPHLAKELLHWRRIGRSFAIAATEVTREQFLRFHNDHRGDDKAAPSSDCPVNLVSWYDAAAYCNWLSEQEGIPPDQWCYEPNAQGKYAQGMKMAANYLQRTGYRLPTEAEWEYACRAGTATRFSFGASDELLPRYGWYLKNSQDRSWPVGSLRPNDFGLFDMHGNDWEWCQGEPNDYAKHDDGTATDDAEDLAPIADGKLRVLHGGPFIDEPSNLRSAARGHIGPEGSSRFCSFRPVRTVPLALLDRYAAARAAARTASRPGKDQPPLDDGMKAKLRRRALDCLEAELNDWSKAQAPRAFIARSLWHWQQAPDLAAIRDASALAMLPPAEQKSFTQFWARVGQTVQPANGTERLEFSRIAVLITAGQSQDEPPFDVAAKAKLHDQALDWLKAELTAAVDRAGKAGIIVVAAPLPGVLEKLIEAAPNDGLFHAELARHYAEQGKTPLANAARTKARALFEAQLAKQPQNAALTAALADLLLLDMTRWTVLRPTKMTSEKGATLSMLPDDSILVSGANIQGDRYRVVLTAETGLNLGALRLEALTHDSLPAKGPGRYPGRAPGSQFQGTFVQTSLSLTATVPNQKEPRTLAFDNATTETARHSITPKGMWSIAGHGEGRACSALWSLSAPVMLPAGTSLTLELHFGGIGAENLGRFRLSVCGDRSALDRQDKRNAALKLSDPWSRLAVAHALDGRTDQALDSLRKALQRADGRAGKAAVIAVAASLPGLLEKLAESAPKDAAFQAEAARHYCERGNMALANAARTKARALCEAQLAKEPQNATVAAMLADVLLADAPPLQLAEMTAEGGATLTRLEDGSILVSGPHPAKNVYTLAFRNLPARLQQLRLEVLPHEALPSQGPGRHPSGEFILSTVKAQLELPENLGQPRILKLAKPWADNSTGSDAEIGYTLDKSDRTGWKTDAGKPHFAVFEFAEPVTQTAGAVLRVTLECKWGLHYTLGRFRISIARDPAQLTDPWVKLAVACAENGWHAKAADFYRKGLAADPNLGADRWTQHRYAAARAAARAAAGPGKDERPLDAAAKTKLRGQALDWLTVELAAWKKLLDSGQPQSGRITARTLSQWQTDTDLAVIREPAALTRLPAPEQKACTQLWNDVAAALKKAETQAK